MFISKTSALRAAHVARPITAFRLLAIGVLAIAAPSACAGPAEEPPAEVQTRATAIGSSAPRVMPLGDSITWGEEMVSGQPRNSGGYRAGLWAGLKWNGFSDVQFVGSSWNAWPPGDPAGMNTAQEGHPGWTSRDLADNVGWILSAGQPEYVLLMIGTNDLFQRMPAAESARAMGSLYDAILGSPRLRRLMVASIIPCASGGSYGDLQNENVARLNGAIHDLVSARASAGAPITFVDMFAWSGIGDADLSDGAHPGDSGYAKMALVWTVVLRDELRRAGW